MNLEDLRDLIVTGYTGWKWYTEYQDRKEKRRSKVKPAKQKPKKRR